MTPGDAAAKLRAFLLPDRGMKRAIVNGMRRGLRRGRAASMKRMRSEGLGRALWLGRNNKRKGISGVPPLIVTVSKVRVANGTYTSGLQAKGMAALIDQGGRTAPHRIKARRGRFLRFGSGDRWSIKSVVNHPGSVVGRVPHLEYGSAIGADAARTEIEAGLSLAVAGLWK